MHRPPYISSLLLHLVVVIPTLQAWKFSTTSVHLSSPPPLNSGDAALNGTPLENYTTSVTSWPCYNYPVPDDVFRTPFPVRGGRLSFILTNNTVGSLSDYQFIGDMYLGQISLGNGSYSTAAMNKNSGEIEGYWFIDTYVWDDFSSGPDCSDPVDVWEAISNALGEPGISTADLVGLNATFGMRIDLFGPNPLVTQMVDDDRNVEEMYQVRECILTSCVPPLDQTARV